jgi:hypothetical protein
MKVLFDECVPAPLRKELRGHNIRTVGQSGWSGIRNGTLLKLAADAGFRVFITVDRGFEHQQNVAALPLPVILVIGKSNDINELLPLMPRVHETLAALPAGLTIIS